MTVTDLSSCFEDEKFFPPGFRFHPTDEELVLYYLKRKMCRRRLKLDIIGETDIYKWDPEELPGLSKLKTGDRQWFFFSPRDRKYPNAARSNRATLHGYWKATGKDRQISCNSRSVGVKKTLVFYSGRAPSGVRTDWVMHEYTLDEEELKRCHSVKDYYALYKVYKKSGPGPKNGEQYGAPFKEEDWADDECLDSNAVVNESNDVILVENNKADNDIDEFLKRIADEELVLDPQPFVLNQIVSQEEAQSTLESGIKFYEGPEVTNMLDQLGTQLIEEDFLENFLEIDDLTCSDLNAQNLKDPVDKSLVNEFTGPSEAELCQDLTLLGEVGPAGPGETLVNEFNGLSEAELCQDLTLLGEVGPGDTLQMCLHNQDEVSFPYKMNSSGGNYLLNGELDAVSHSYLNSITENELHYQMLIQDQNCNIFTSTESNQGVIRSNSGEVHDCNPANHSNQTQNGIGKVDEKNDPWFSSALWGWLESMPTDTASAAESPIANRTCFRRGISSNQSQNDTVGAAPKRLARSKSLFLSFLILGVICALLSVLIRTSMVSGRYNY